MATFSDIKTAVSRRLQDASNTAVSLVDVAASVNDAIRYWKYRRFWFNEKSTTITLTLQNQVFPVPSDFLVPAVLDNGFNIQYSGSRYPLSKILQQDYDAVFQDNGYGMPRMYAQVGNNSYNCYPIPDRAYTVGCHYLKEYADLSGDFDTNDFTVNASRLITLWASANCAGDFRQDEKMESYFRQAAMNEYSQLSIMNNKVNSTGKLKITSII